MTTSLTKMTTATPGNTTPVVSSRNFQLTLNEIDKYDELLNYLNSLKSLNYLLSCIETAPTTGHKHIHIYTQFNKPIRLSIKKTCGAHIEKCYGSPQQNIDYIKKDGNILDEIGIIRLSGNIKTVEDLKKIDISECPPNYYNIKKKIDEEDEKDIDINDLHKNIEVYYIQGESGIGKTEKMKELVKNLQETYGTKINMVKYENGFYLGTGNARICIYDDWRDSHMKPSEFINFIDYNKHYMNIKGGSKLNNYELIIITSIQRLENIYKNVREEQKEQWMRRLKIVNLYPADYNYRNLLNDDIYNIGV